MNIQKKEFFFCRGKHRYNSGVIILRRQGIRLTKQQTGLAETLDMVAEKAKCDHCAKKILAFKAVSAWIVKDCVKEFSDCSVDYISEHCLSGDAEVSDSQ